MFETNDLERYGSYEDFKSSIFVLQSNPGLDLLSYEYQARLAAAGLSPVDRACIEEEFRTRWERVTDPRFSLNLREDARVAPMPPSLATKVLDDTLATWARQAGERKWALRYNVTVFSKNVLKPDLIDLEDYITAIDILRTQVRRIIAHIDEIATLPGAAVIRIGDARLSLLEIHTYLEDILRFKLQPLIGMIRQRELSKDPRLLALYVDNQLFQIKLAREEAQKRVTAVQESLCGYVLQKGAVAVPEAGSAGARPGVAPPGETATMMPPPGESFLDHLVELPTMGSAMTSPSWASSCVKNDCGSAVRRRSRAFALARRVHS